MVYKSEDREKMWSICLILLLLISANGREVKFVIHAHAFLGVSAAIFPPVFRGENDGFLSMRMQVILDSLFACPGPTPMLGNVGCAEGRVQELNYGYKGYHDLLLCPERSGFEI